MLVSSDIIAGKILVQWRVLDARAVRDALRQKDADPAAGGDLLARLSAAGKLDAARAEDIRGRVGLYERARAEAAYLRGLERRGLVAPEEATALLREAEEARPPVRVRDLLAARERLSLEQHTAIKAGSKAALARDDERVVARYRQEDFTGVAKGLLPGSRLDPDDLRTSRLFRAPQPAAPAPAALPSPSAQVAQEEEVEEDEPEVAVERLDMEGVKRLTRIADYAVVELLGAGGMGAVFLAQKVGAAVFTAVKVMLNQAATREEKARFKREIALTRRVHHKNVIGILDTGSTAGGLTYLVVPALVGKELRALIDAAGGRGLAPDVACRIFEQVLDGLQAIHDARIIHRDMKPENVMVLVGPERQVKLMDLGLARLVGEPDANDADANFRTLGNEVSGSPAYIAPETILGNPLDHRTDLYSAGIMFFEMLTGKLPFESETAQGFLGQHVAMPPLTLDEACPDRAWPEEAERLIARLLAKTPEERPGSCAEVAAILRGGLSAALSATALAPAAPPAARVPEKAVVAEAPPATQPRSGTFISRGILGRLIAKGLGRG